MMKLVRSIGLMVCLLLANNSFAEGTIISIEGATIRGNQELPTVLYLVPWQPPKVYELDKPEQSLASSRPLKMLDRASFLRMQSYHKTFTEKLSQAEPAPAKVK